MTIKSKVFNYFDISSNIPKADNDTFVGILPRGISDVISLFEGLISILLLPRYFGFNWNALSDCLRDFHWIKEKTIVLVHEEIPQLSGDDLYEYLDVLCECVNDWGEDEDHVLAVWFPEDCKEAIAAAID